MKLQMPLAGLLLGVTSGTMAQADDGNTFQVKSTEIAQQTPGGIAPADQATAAWTLTRAQGRVAPTLQAVIDLHQKFVDQYPRAPQIADARKALDGYRAMLAKDPVKYRGTWMPRAEMAELTRLASEAARPVLDLYMAGQLKAALDAAAPLTTDDQNTDALMLAGLSAYRLKNYPVAKSHFTKLVAADASSVAAENNLAVVCMTQKQLPEAFTHFTKALQIMPAQRVLIDNVAEAVHAWDRDKNNATYKALMAAYAPAEVRMQEQMARVKQYRWGSTWVTKDQKDRLAKTDTTVREMMSKLDLQYRTFQTRLAQLQKAIQAANTQMDGYDLLMTTAMNQLNQPDQNQLALNASIIAAQKNLNAAQAYRDQLQNYYNQLSAGTRDFFAEAEKLKAAAGSASSEQFTGTPRLIDWGETDNPAAPVTVTEVTLPEIKIPEVITNPPPLPAIPVTTPIPPLPAPRLPQMRRGN